MYVWNWHLCKYNIAILCGIFDRYFSYCHILMNPLVCRYQEVQHVRVFKQNGKYGFSPPCTFSSLMELVLYFSEHLLSQDNASLHTTLQFPFFSENKQ